MFLLREIFFLTVLDCTGSTAINFNAFFLTARLETLRRAARLLVSGLNVPSVSWWPREIGSLMKA